MFKKDLEVGDKEKPVFTKGIYKDLKLLYDTNFIPAASKNVGFRVWIKKYKPKLNNFSSRGVDTKCVENQPNLIFCNTNVFTFCINHTTISPAANTIKARVYSSTKPTTLPRKLKMAPTHLSAIAQNASITFLESLFRASASLFNHFLKALPFFSRDNPGAGGPPLSKTSVIASTVVEAVIEKGVSIDVIVISYLRNKVQTLSAKDVICQEHFRRCF